MLADPCEGSGASRCGEEQPHRRRSAWSNHAAVRAAGKASPRSCRPPRPKAGLRLDNSGNNVAGSFAAALWHCYNTLPQSSPDRIDLSIAQFRHDSDLQLTRAMRGWG